MGVDTRYQKFPEKPENPVSDFSGAPKMGSECSRKDENSSYNFS